MSRQFGALADRTARLQDGPTPEQIAAFMPHQTRPVSGNNIQLSGIPGMDPAQATIQKPSGIQQALAGMDDAFQTMSTAEQNMKLYETIAKIQQAAMTADPAKNRSTLKNTRGSSRAMLNHLNVNNNI